MDLNDLNKVWEVKPLKKVREEEAREILERVSKQVQPIMRKRKWKVKLLSEFWYDANCKLFNPWDAFCSNFPSRIDLESCSPTNPSLLGLNIGGGSEVKLRLRRPNNDFNFFPYEQILDTMLHELCHNEVGPHNADFYNLLDEIRKECEELMAKGITGTGQGFDLPGRRLGGHSRQPPLPSLRQKALAAAENRAQRGGLLPIGPKRLGGDSSIKAVLSPIQAAAMAAERRLHDDLWCGSKSAESEGSSESLPVSVAMGERFAPSSEGDSISTQGNKDEASWQCNACTLLNRLLALTCEACGTPKSKGCGGESLRWWACKFCTLDNSIEMERCMACGEWRYSYGSLSAPGSYPST